MSEAPKTDALEAKLLENREQLLGFIRSKVSDTQAAEDILHDSLIKALGALDQIEDEDKLVSWFYRIVRNSIIDRHRSEQTEQKYTEKYARDVDPFETPKERDALCQCFRELIPALKDDYQEMIETMELGEADTGEVAERLEITTNNLKVRRYRARQKLKQELEVTCGKCAERGCLECTCGD